MWTRRSVLALTATAALLKRLDSPISPDARVGDLSVPDRQMVEILTAVLGDGLSAVEAACAEALREGVHSADVVLNILARQREPPAPVPLLTPENLRLRHEPVADCARYDSLRRAP